MVQLPQWFYRLRQKLRTAFNPIPEKIAPGNCGDCLFWMEFKQEAGAGFCPLKKEIREDCECSDTMFRKCKGIDKDTFLHLCNTCTDTYPDCYSEISFLENHPLIDKWNLPTKLRDLIWGCNNYQLKEEKKDENSN